MQRVAVVSGGADGIGKEVSLELYKAGYAVAAFDINEEKIKQISEEIGANNFVALKCNAIDENSVQECFSKIMEQFGRIDVLVNVVGGSLAVSQPVDQIEASTWDKVVALNLRSLFLCTKEAVKVMRGQKYGRIINFSSMAGRSRSVFGGAPYAAAKAGVLGFTRQCSKDLGPLGITINAVAPGTVLSGDRINGFWAKKSEKDKQKFFDDNPSGRLGVPRDIARTVLFLCDEEASYINGAVIDVNGGMWVG